MRMESSVYVSNKISQMRSTMGEDPIEIQLYTDKACMFHKEAIKLTRYVAQEMSCYGRKIRVMEKSIEDCEEQNIYALPTFVIGGVQITGLPTRSKLFQILRYCIHSSHLDL